MPFIRFQSNVALDEAQSSELLSRLSRVTAEQLGKPEQYVMVAIESAAPMLFAGSDEPLAYLELKSIGLPESRTPDLSNALASVVEETTNVQRDRVYIEFSNAPRNMWGWNGGTF